MTRKRYVLPLCLLCLLAGCGALPGVSVETPVNATSAGTDGPAATTGAPTAGDGGAASPTGTAGGSGDETATPTPTPEPADLTVEYVIRPGAVPSEFQSVTVEFEVVFAEQASDLDRCIGTLLGSKYEPTPTALPTPTGACQSQSGLSVDLTGIDGTETLGPFTVDGRFDGAYALVVRDVVPVFADGTAPTAVYDTDFRAHTQRGRGSGRYGVEIGITDAGGGVPWDYAVYERSVDPNANATTGTVTGTPAGTATPGNATGAPTATPAGTATPPGTNTPAGNGTVADG